MQCDKGTLPGPLYVPPRFPTLAGQPWCNTADRDPVLNKFNFGVCAVTQKPCPATCQPLRWLDVSKEVEVAGHPALFDCSFIMCAVGGRITLLTTGQPA